jgi:hypothetical protein
MSLFKKINDESIEDSNWRQPPSGGRKQQPQKGGGGGKILLVIVAFACAAFAYGSYKETCGNLPVEQCAQQTVSDFLNSTH